MAMASPTRSRLCPPPPLLRAICAALLLTTPACDNAASKSPSLSVDAFVDGLSAVDLNALATEARASAVPGSVDAIFLELTTRYPGFGGAYEDGKGRVVLISSRPNETRTASGDVVSDLADFSGLTGRAAQAFRDRSVSVEAGQFDFAQLAAIKLAVRQLAGRFPIVGIDADERTNRVALDLDDAAGDLLDAVPAALAALGVPTGAVVVGTVRPPRFVADPVAGPSALLATDVGGSSLTLSDSVRPIAGGLQVDRPGRCTLGLPLWYTDGASGQKALGFLTASHCTGFTGFNNGAQWGQPTAAGGYIGLEIEDPPLTNCGANSSNCDLVDVALAKFTNGHDTVSLVAPGGVYLTESASSTGSGGYTVTGSPVPLWPLTLYTGASVNKVGWRTGWTTGQVTATGYDIAISVRHPDGVMRLTWVRGTTRTSVPVAVGDSGSALFKLVYGEEPPNELAPLDGDGNPLSGWFSGILSACGGCGAGPSGPSYFVPWAAVESALTTGLSFSNSQSPAW